MHIPDFEITIWHVPHRGDGYLVHIDTEFSNDGYSAFHQPTTNWRNPQFDPGQPHKSANISAELLNDLVGQLNDTAVSFAEQSHASILGGSHYGVRLSRALQEIVLIWSPRFEDQAAQIRELWTLVESTVEV